MWKKYEIEINFPLNNFSLVFVYIFGGKGWRKVCKGWKKHRKKIWRRESRKMNGGRKGH